MSNQAYLGVWCKDFPEDRVPERLGAFLGTVPLSTARPGFTYLTIRAVDAAETPVLEEDLRAAPLAPERILEIARQHLHSDSCYEVRCHWDLSIFDAATGKARVEPQPLEIFCHGEDYDDCIWRENGHFQVDLGFEHLFTGHAGLLGTRPNGEARPQSPEEARFLEIMAWPENLEKYQDATRENIRRIFSWIRRIQQAMPVDRIRSWSEGEDNFEARLEGILAAR